MRYNNIQDIKQAFPDAWKQLNKGTREFDTDSPLYLAIHALYEHEMPYEMATGDIGDPTEYIIEQLTRDGAWD